MWALGRVVDIKMAYTHRDTDWEIWAAYWGPHIHITIWDPVAGPGRTPMEWKQFGSEPDPGHGASV